MGGMALATIFYIKICHPVQRMLDHTSFVVILTSRKIEITCICTRVKSKLVGFEWGFVSHIQGDKSANCTCLKKHIQFMLFIALDTVD